MSTPGAVLVSAPPGGFPKRPAPGDGAKSVEKKKPKAVKQAPEKEPALDREKRKLVQRGLASLGLYRGFIDGAFGPRTRKAISSWQKAKGFGETGRMTKEQGDALAALGGEALREKAGRERREREARETAERERLERDRREREAREREEAERKAREAAERERLAREERAKAAAKRKAREEAARKRALLRPGRVFRDCPECPEMVVVPAGSYLMGSPHDEKGRQKDEGPRHSVTIDKPFAVGRYEVTRREFGAFVRATDWSMDGGCLIYDSGERKWKRNGARVHRQGGMGLPDDAGPDGQSRVRSCIAASLRLVARGRDTERSDVFTRLRGSSRGAGCPSGCTRPS